MHHAQIDPSEGFEVLTGTEQSQAATMVLEPGEVTGGPDNRHPRSDQWLYVISGRGRALVEDREIALAPGVLVLIERGEGHEVRCEGREPLRTLNVYAAPAYDEEGDELA